MESIFDGFWMGVVLFAALVIAWEMACFLVGVTVGVIYYVAEITYRKMTGDIRT